MSHPKVALCVIGFQCIDEIPRCLDEVAPHVTYVILGDGRFSNFKWDTDFSNDGWLEYAAKRYENAITYRFCGDQVDKRQRYLDIAASEGCDYVIVWDTDEFIDHNTNRPTYPDWPLFYDRLERLSKAFPEEHLFQMWAYLPSVSEWERAHNIAAENTYQPYIRIIKNPGEIKYSINHYSFVKRDAEPHDWLKSWLIVDGVRFTMDSKLRNPAFLQARDKWALDNQSDEQVRMFRYLNDRPELFKALMNTKS